MWLQGGSQAYVGKGRLRLTTREVDLLSVCVTKDTPHTGVLYMLCCAVWQCHVQVKVCVAVGRLIC